MHAIDERITVAGPEVVGVRLTQAADARGMAPVSFALGWVFALPYLLVMAPLRALAVAVAWRDLRRRPG